MNLLQGAHIWTTGFWVAVVQKFFPKKSPVSNPLFVYMKMRKTCDVLFLEHRKSVIHHGWCTKSGIRLGFPVSFSLQPVSNFHFGKKFTCRPVFFEKNRCRPVSCRPVWPKKRAVVQIYAPLAV